MRKTAVFAATFIVAAAVLGVLLLANDDNRSTAASRGAVQPRAAAAAQAPSGFLDTPAQQRGRIESVEYPAPYESRTVRKRALVYLPAGYDAADRATRYDVLYLMHGAGMNETSFFGGSDGSSPFVNLLDHMIEQRLVKPMIVVTPTYYPDARERSMDLHDDGRMDRVFPRELKRALMPAVEREYHTYARTPDAAGFRASRAHRAFGGFSMGAVTTWYAFIDDLDSFKYFMPMAGDAWVIEDMGGVGAPGRTAAYLADVVRRSGLRKDDFLIAASVGASDGTTYQMQPQIREMRKLSDSFDSGSRGNLRYTQDPGGGHDLQSVYNQFYGSIRLFF
jgi:enterochelin esterase-like enzyme